MATLKLTQKQILRLVQQLSPIQQEAVFKLLLARRRSEWGELSRYGQEKARQVAVQRGRNWDAMTEEEREQFVDDLVHEDHPCAG